MIVSPWLIVLAVAGQSTPSTFRLLDVETIDGRAVNRYRELELSGGPVRPISWEIAPTGTVRHGLARIGPRVEASPAVAWEPDASALWVDADGDSRMAREERHEVTPGSPVAIPVTIGGTDPARRTLLVRPGLLGTGPRVTVRGAMQGELTLAGKTVRAILIDADADGGFDAAGTDRVWLDLNGDGRFDAVAEQFPLGSPISTGGTVYTIASDHGARQVAAHERDTRLGHVRLHLGDRSRGGDLVSLSANLVSKTGELVTVRALDTPTEAPVGSYRVVGITLQLSGDSGRIWSYTFSGGNDETIAITPGGEASADLLAGLSFQVSAAEFGGTRPGDDVDATPKLVLGSGLYLANCTTRIGAAAIEQEKTARIVLLAPDGAVLDEAVSGFA